MRKTLVVALCALALSFQAGCSKKEKAEGENVAAQAGAAKAESPGAKVDSVAHTHLPDNCQMVATVDWQKLREMQSVKANLETELSKLDKPKDGKSPVTDQDIKDLMEFLEKTDINLRTDPAGFAVCLTNIEKAKGDEPPTVVAIVGGKFRPGAAMEVLDSVTERFKGLLRRAASAGDSKKTEPEIIEIGGLKVVHDKTENVYLAQAKDGAFVIGNDRAQFEKALAPSEAHKAYKLSKESIGVVLTKAMAPLLNEGAANSPYGDVLKTFQNATIGISERHVLADLTLEDEKKVTELKTQLEMLTKQLASAPNNPMAALFKDAKFTSAGKTLTFDVNIPEEAVNGLLRQMGGPMGGPGVGGPPGMGGPAGMPPGAAPGMVPPPSPAAAK